jgi:hypothetical protein
MNAPPRLTLLCVRENHETRSGSGPVKTIFAPAAWPIRDAPREAVRLLCGHSKRTATKGSARIDPPLRVAAGKRVCGVAPLGKGMTLAGTTRLASIAFSR